jgi:complement component 1 Q subcomponent-binding protein, mitochondrial
MVVQVCIQETRILPHIDLLLVSDELIAKLQSEITVEEGIQEDEDLSANIKEYLDNSAFEVPSPVMLYKVSATNFSSD